MKRELERDNDKHKNSYGHIDKAQENELLTLTCFVRRAPKAIQRQLVPFLQQLRKEYPQEETLKELIEEIRFQEESKAETNVKVSNMLKSIVKLLDLKNISNGLLRGDRVHPQSKSLGKMKGNAAIKSDGFEKMDIVYPEYDIYYKMSKQEREHHLPQQHYKKAERDFFADPRFLVRIQEFAHYKSNEKLKGNIIFLKYQGSIITGSKSYAIVRDRYIQIWFMESNGHVIPTLSTGEQTTEEVKKKEEQKKEQEKKEVQKEAEKQINEISAFQMVAVLNGHTEKITSLSFSLDQYYLISGSADRTIKLWCVRTKTCLCTYKSHLKIVWDVDFSQSGYFFLSGSGDGWMILWKTDEPHPQRVYNHKGDVYKVKFAKDPSFVISGGQDGVIKIWKTMNAQVQRQLRLNRPVINFSLGFSGVLLVSLESDGKMTIFDLLKGTIINSFYFYQEKKDKTTDKKVILKKKVHDICLSEDERELACVSSKNIALYSMDRLEMKVTKNIYSFNQENNDEKHVTKITAKEVIYVGQKNLTFCRYQQKNVLVVGGTC